MAESKPRKRKLEPWDAVFRDRDRRPIWKRYDAAKGLALGTAAVFYGDDYHAERFTRLTVMGYDVEPEFDPWDQSGRGTFFLRNIELRESKSRLEYLLIEKLSSGELVATGYSNGAALDEPATRILHDRWRTLTADFQTSIATSPGLVVTGIMVFDPKLLQRDQADRPVRGFSQAELKRWYREWIRTNQQAGTQPSRDEDWREVCSAFARPIPREVVRQLRRELAPPSWISKGRRKT